jgi:hypothetical protein
MVRQSDDVGHDFPEGLQGVVEYQENRIQEKQTDQDHDYFQRE